MSFFQRFFLPRVLAACCLLAAAFASPADAQSRRAPFYPERHGFNFDNTFSNDFVQALDVRTGGLCGGMVYAALDYYFFNVPIPRQDYRPANRTTLQSYIYNRQVNSIVPNVPMWAAMGINPDGAADNVLFRGSVTDQFQSLKRSIDRNEPVPLGMQAVDGRTHQVLAIGYWDTGRIEDMRIIIYDPNFRNETITMRPSTGGPFFYYEGKFDREDRTKYHWRAFFVDRNYARKSPPALSTPGYPDDGRVRELVIHFETGDDDLRGGKDNVNLIVHLADGARVSLVTVNRINLGARWLSNYTEFASVVLPRPVPRNQIRAFEFTTTFGGGIGGDNWDVKRIRVDAYRGSSRERLVERTNFFRFTGNQRSVRLNMSGAAPAARLITHIEFGIRTGNDDLRGGNDNVDATVLYRDGRRQVIRDLNARQRWEDGSSHVRRFALDRPVPREDIVGVTLTTTSKGGIGGDNWNMDYLRVTSFEGGANRGDYYLREATPLKRFTGNDRSFTARW